MDLSQPWSDFEPSYPPPLFYRGDPVVIRRERLAKGPSQKKTPLPRAVRFKPAIFRMQIQAFLPIELSLYGT